MRIFTNLLGSYALLTENPQLADLLQQAGLGDRGAFGQVYECLKDRVYGLALRMTVDASMAEDVAHEAWMSVWKSAPNFVPTKGSAEGWVLAICHRRAVDLIRKVESDRRRNDAYTQLETATSIEASAADGALANLDRDDVTRCFEQLSEKQRETLSLVYFGGMTQREVAAKLAVTPSAIKTRIRDAMVSLRRCMG